MAETGVPVSAGPGGPGPASGSLLDIKAASDSAGPHTGGLPPSQASEAPSYGQTPAVVAHESAEEEKRRLAASYAQQSAAAAAPSEPAPSASAAPVSQPPRQESAEEEKKRLEREERERILHAGGSGPSDAPKDKDEDLPPYQEPGTQ
jgi:hypothetical protein